MINNMDSINELLQKVGVFLVAVSAALSALWQLVKSLKPAINFLAFLGTQILPNGFIVWFWLYHSALNANRLTEPAVFLSLVGEELVLLVIYNLFWGIWLYPRIKFLLPNFTPPKVTSDTRKNNGNDKKTKPKKVK